MGGRIQVVLVGNAGTGSAFRYSTGSNNADSVHGWCSTYNAGK